MKSSEKLWGTGSARSTTPVPVARRLPSVRPTGQVPAIAVPPPAIPMRAPMAVPTRSPAIPAAPLANSSHTASAGPAAAMTASTAAAVIFAILLSRLPSRILSSFSFSGAAGRMPVPPFLRRLYLLRTTIPATLPGCSPVTQNDTPPSTWTECCAPPSRSPASPSTGCANPPKLPCLLPSTPRLNC